MEKNLTRIVAATVIVLGLVSVNSGLNLAGSPWSANNLIGLLTGAAPTNSAPVSATTAAPPAGHIITVHDDGYSPSRLRLPAGQVVELRWVTQDVHSCALSVVIPGLNYEKVLPATGQVALQIPPQKSGTVMHYSCSMGMYTGQLVFDQE